ncbi:hypothetical protein Plhal304r1_c012g0046841 [Plasmopara halstedii]
MCCAQAEADFRQERRRGRCVDGKQVLRLIVLSYPQDGRLDEDEKTLVAGKSVQISIEVLYMLSEVPTLISSRRPILLFRSFSLGVLEKSGTIEERTKLDPNHNAFVRLTRTSMG